MFFHLLRTTLELNNDGGIGDLFVVLRHLCKQKALRRKLCPGVDHDANLIGKNEQKEQTVITYPSYLTIVDAHMARRLAGMSWTSTLSSSLCRISSTSDHNQTPIQTQASHPNTWIGRAR